MAFPLTTLEVIIARFWKGKVGCGVKSFVLDYVIRIDSWVALPRWMRV